MEQFYWSNWSIGWGWVLWIGLVILVASNIGNWSYTYSAHQKQAGQPKRNALDILNERYVHGEILRDEYDLIRSRIVAGL